MESWTRTPGVSAFQADVSKIDARLQLLIIMMALLLV